MSILEKIIPHKTEAAEIIENNQDYTLFSWSKQKGTNPIAVKYGEGVYLYDYDGKKALAIRELYAAQGKKENWRFLFYHDVKSAIARLT